MATPDFNTVADSISKISVSGLKIYDLNEMPQSVMRDLPCVMPAPNFVTNFRPVNISIDRQEMDFTYNLNYRLFATPVGAGRGIHETYQKITAALALFLAAIATNHSITGAVDLQIENIGEFGVVKDPSDADFAGCSISLSVQEFK